MRVWFKQDTEFRKPKTIMNFDFSSPMAYADPLNCNLTHMFVHLFKDQLNEYLYDAELAGLRFGVSNTANGISVSEMAPRQGYNPPTEMSFLFFFVFAVVDQRLQSQAIGIAAKGHGPIVLF